MLSSMLNTNFFFFSFFDFIAQAICIALCIPRMCIYLRFPCCPAARIQSNIGMERAFVFISCHIHFRCSNRAYVCPQYLYIYAMYIDWQCVKVVYMLMIVQTSRHRMANDIYIYPFHCGQSKLIFVFCMPVNCHWLDKLIRMMPWCGGGQRVFANIIWMRLYWLRKKLSGPRNISRLKNMPLHRKTFHRVGSWRHK